MENHVFNKKQVGAGCSSEVSALSISDDLGLPLKNATLRNHKSIAIEKLMLGLEITGSHLKNNHHQVLVECSGTHL
jgi:hypothetical protein